MTKRHTLPDSKGTCLHLQCWSHGHTWPQSTADMAIASEELLSHFISFDHCEQSPMNKAAPGPLITVSARKSEKTANVIDMFTPRSRCNFGMKNSVLITSRCRLLGLLDEDRN